MNENEHQWSAWENVRNATVLSDGLSQGDYVVSYSSNKPEIASVNAKGKITGKKKGTAIITVSCGKKTAKCKVKVK